MNIGGIKAFLGGEEAVRPDTRINKQLQAEGLKQAREFQQTNLIGTFSSQYSIAYKVMGDSLRQNVQVDGKQNNSAAETKSPEKETSGFDFEAIVENVMQFVGGVIRSAAKGGASDEKLTDLFSQAREGVSKGIGLAKRDLAGLMTDELTRGIGKAESALFSEIDSLEKSIFGSDAITTELSASFSSFKGTELLIRTRDGDEVTLVFGQQQQRVAYSQNTISDPQSLPANELNDSDNPGTYQSKYNLSFFERMGISLTINGDLDDKELSAIKDLVNQIADVADQFFNGDVEKAFNEALDLGYDKEELVGYSLQLTKAKSTTLASTYEDVSQFTQQAEKQSSNSRDIQPALSYIDDVLKTMEFTSKTVESTKDYNNIVSEIVNQMDAQIETPDLLSAINRFHQFNNDVVETADKVMTKNER